MSWEQLVAAGIDRNVIQVWIEDGRLHPVHHGVYAVGHPGRSMLADYMAAVLACGAGAALSHWPAAHVMRLLPNRVPRRPR